MYNPDFDTFFTIVDELGVIYHEMHYVLGLRYGEFPYKEHFPTNRELQEMEESSLGSVLTYWEVLCHFNICMDLYEQ